MASVIPHSIDKALRPKPLPMGPESIEVSVKKNFSKPSKGFAEAAPQSTSLGEPEKLGAGGAAAQAARVIPPISPKPQRASGEGRFSVNALAGRSRIRRLFQRGSAKVRFPTADDGILDAVLINTAGGLAGGDRFAWELDVAEQARCRVVTQASEKVYRSTGDACEVTVLLKIADGATLEWLPQETILFKGSRLKRTYDIDVAPGARLLAVEALVLGRHAMGEINIDAFLHDSWRVRRGGKLVFADELKLSGSGQSRGGVALLGGAQAVASILMIGNDVEGRLARIRPLLGETSGASAFDGKLFCRLLEADGLGLRRRLTAVVGALRNGSAMPRQWTV